MAIDEINSSDLNEKVEGSNSSIHSNEQTNKSNELHQINNDAVPLDLATIPTHLSTPSSKPRSRTENFFIMTAMCIGVFLAAIDSVIITTALPTISAAFHASDSGFAWIGTAYFIANGTSMPFWGKISEIFGRKPIFLISNIIFMIGSLIAALSKDLNVLIGGRVIQGFGGGGLMALPNVIVTDLFSIRDRPFYLGILGSVWGVAGALGPILGGAFAERAGWRWCFWFNLPCSGVSVTLIIFLLKVYNPKTPLKAGLKSMDWLGAITISAGTVMFLLGLEFGGVTFPWSSPKVICLLVFGVLTMGIFMLIQWKLSPRPIVPLQMFTNRNNICAILVCVCHSLCYMAGMYYIPLYYQAGLGYTPIFSGVLFLIVAVPSTIALMAGGIYVSKTGKYTLMMRLGFPMLVLAHGLFINFTPYRSYPRIALFSIIWSCGISTLFQGPLIALQANLDPKDMGMGTATFAFIRQLSAGVSIVIGQVIFQSGMHGKLNTLLAAGVDSSLAETLAEGNAITATFLVNKLDEAQKLVVRTAVVDALDKMWIFYAAVAGVGFLVCWGIQRKELSGKYVEYKTGLKDNEKVVAEAEKEKEVV